MRNEMLITLILLPFVFSLLMISFCNICKAESELRLMYYYPVKLSHISSLIKRSVELISTSFKFGDIIGYLEQSEDASCV